VFGNAFVLALLIVCSSSGSLSGCSQSPLDIVCPAVSKGDLVVTEIHGPQSGLDTYGEWIEIYNGSSATIDFSGLSVSLQKLDGSSEMSLLVRSSLSVAAGDYAVLGRQFPEALPSHVDYGYADDIDSKLYDSAAVTLRSCETQIDLAVYRNLPTKGSLVLDGAISPPRSDTNLDANNWCVDDHEDADTEQMGLRGSPGEENPPCLR